MDGWQKDDPLFRSARNKIFAIDLDFVHTRLGLSIDIILIEAIKGADMKESAFPTKKSLIMFTLRTREILREMDFSRKVKVAVKMNAISKELEGKLMKVQQLRNYFAHPDTYQDKIHEMETNSDVYLAAQTSLIEAYEMTYKIFRDIAKEIAKPNNEPKQK